ncbi:MAG TPA: tRNA epoxyqueuosine(34) reductase QueG [Oligoflexus sp.]|uniref:tRNA epoxyqueuosine(34) reductase QueG n=1 Tax=Oligoflexus sp. TaxID=1971216 RepID=UPI002D23F6F7|nr:tRNA epoxyqueuosine(34) reductase QueG [Oligoflexus sp.]HYX39481.1 tRNA epoxyqueuosine(34) reductase QueG [Oligoflexus sp.]
MKREELQKLCSDQGLLLLGLVDLGPEPRFQLFEQWLSEGQHAGMQFLENNKQLREDPRGLLPDSVQALVFALPYFQGDKLNAALQGRYRVAQYARLRDYHKSMKLKATRILSVLQEKNPGLEGRVTIDSAPLLERALAARTMRGFIGKNTCFIHPDHGSLMLIGEILLSQPLTLSDPVATVDPNQRNEDGGCGTCRRCQVNCPTGALDTAYKLDARKCLAYWTIEHRGTIPYEFWPYLPTYVFGCDLCQLACPYNRKALLTDEPTRPDLINPDLFDLATMDQKRYEAWMGGTPLTRAKREGLRRNALIALAVTQDVRLAEACAFVKAEDADVLHQTLRQIESWISNGGPLR